ncbi:MAG: hypothetical protein ACI89L_002121 [Phycisphaerales bacterium]|jgi:hypothetical protein
MNNLPRPGRIVLLAAVVGSCSLNAPALGQWFGEAKLLPSDGTGGDRFGDSIAIDNGVVAVGAFGDGNSSGSAYLFDAATGNQIA